MGRGDASVPTTHPTAPAPTREAPCIQEAGEPVLKLFMRHWDSWINLVESRERREYAIPTAANEPERGGEVSSLGLLLSRVDGTRGSEANC